MGNGETSCRLDLGRLALEDLEHHGKLLVGRLEGVSAHRLASCWTSAGITLPSVQFILTHHGTP
jgi:hypothetical protein